MGQLKGLVFDFDGVILESAGLKTRAFEQTFDQWPERLADVRAYHLAHAGISRHVKVRHICREILQLAPDEAREAELVARFAALVDTAVLMVPMVPGAESFLRGAAVPCCVASGTPEIELQRIVEARGLGPLFAEVCGAPASKAEILTSLMRVHGWHARDVVFVGDAETDRDAAAAVGMPFIARVHAEGTLPATGWWIHDLTELPVRLRAMEDARL